LGLSSGILQPYADDPDSSDNFFAGYVWEEVVVRLLTDKYNVVRLGEFELDGIIGTPDAVDIREWVLEEYKCTRKSSNSNPLDNWRWMTQIAGYLKMTGMTQCRLRVYHMLGDYRGAKQAKPLHWLITFLPHEIEETWQMLINHARQMKEGG
jgi:hypothetical protein